MAVLVDPPMWPAHGRRWSHLVSDGSYAELHAFARRLGIPERGFEGDHYDVPEERYADIVRAGAIPVSSRELLRRLQASGLRRPKRRGERVVASIPQPDGSRIDTLLSAREPSGPVVGVILLARHVRDVLVLPDGDGLALPQAALHTGADRQNDRETPVAVVRRLLRARLTGDPEGPLNALGYLRQVSVADGVIRVEVVLGWVAAEEGERPVAAPPGSWYDAWHAAALLPPLLAPLVRPRH